LAIFDSVEHDGGADEPGSNNATSGVGRSPRHLLFEITATTSNY